MEIYDYINKIKETIKIKKEYNLYSHIFKEYILFLEELLKKEPSNIKAVCQLAIAYYENRCDTDICLKLMEETLQKFDLSMSLDSKTELLNNLACFYDIEYGNTLKAKQILEYAVQLNTKYQKSYYGLAYLTADSNPEYALDVINKIPQKDNIPVEYQSLFAYILMINGKYNDALCYLNKLLLSSNKETIEKSLYNSAIIFYKTNETEKAIRIADKLYKDYKKRKNEEILTFELIHLYFILQNYEKVIGLFCSEKTENIFIDVNIIKLYFYALKKIKSDVDCEKIYRDKMNEITNDIEEIKNDVDCSENEKSEYINSYENDKRILTQNYSDIVINNQKPEVDNIFYYSSPKRICYFIDCPRHS